MNGKKGNTEKKEKLLKAIFSFQISIITLHNEQKISPLLLLVLQFHRKKSKLNHTILCRSCFLHHPTSFLDKFQGWIFFQYEHFLLHLQMPFFSMLYASYFLCLCTTLCIFHDSRIFM